MIRRALESIAIALLFVVCVPVIVVMVLYDAGCAAWLWITTGSTWGNWRDRV